MSEERLIKMERAKEIARVVMWYFADVFSFTILVFILIGAFLHWEKELVTVIIGVLSIIAVIAMLILLAARDSLFGDL